MLVVFEQLLLAVFEQQLFEQQLFEQQLFEQLLLAVSL
jgi:hypothetical protein